MKIILAKCLEVRQSGVTSVDILGQCCLGLEDRIPLVLRKLPKLSR